MNFLQINLTIAIALFVYCSSDLIICFCIDIGLLKIYRVKVSVIINLTNYMYQAIKAVYSSIQTTLFSSDWNMFR